VLDVTNDTDLRLNSVSADYAELTPGTNCIDDRAQPAHHSATPAQVVAMRERLIQAVIVAVGTLKAGLAIWLILALRPSQLPL
jgi:hypothetical protein